MDDGRSTMERVAVTAARATAVDQRPPSDADARRSLAGTLVHRLFERCGATLRSAAGTQAIEAELGRLIRDEEAVEAGDVVRLFRHTRDAYLALCATPALIDALESGEALFEVPFSVRPASHEVILRGTFDCLIHRRDGGITVLGLKTGKPVPEHERQLATYLLAARALFPGTPVDGTLVYAAPRTV
jgi:RecB family exonuclease